MQPDNSTRLANISNLRVTDRELTAVCDAIIRLLIRQNERMVAAEELKVASMLKTKASRYQRKIRKVAA